MPKSAKPLPPLSDIQKAALQLYWYEDAHALLERVWPNRPELTLRHVEWKSCRAYLASLDPKTLPKPPSAESPESALLSPPQNPVPPEYLEDDDGSSVDDPLGEPLDSEMEGVPDAAPSKSPLDANQSIYAALTAEQQQFIQSNYKQANNPTELARTLFDDPSLMPGSRQTKCVAAYIRKIDPGYRRYDEPAEAAEYTPPRTIVQLAGRLNRYGIGTRPDGKMLFDGNKFTAQEQKQLEALLRYMSRPAFKVEADGFTKRIDREVFEEIFMSSCWDKPDLTPEYVLQYIQLASVSVQRNQADRTVRKLTERFEDSLDDPTKRLSKTEVDALKNTADKTAETLKQMNALIKTLQGDRARKEEARQSGTASMHPLVAAWKDEESRRKMIALVQKKQQADLKKEVERFSSMDALKGELWGVDPATIIH